jgi:hypothetical protein
VPAAAPASKAPPTAYAAGAQLFHGEGEGGGGPGRAARIGFEDAGDGDFDPKKEVVAEMSSWADFT